MTQPLPSPDNPFAPQATPMAPPHGGVAPAWPATPQGLVVPDAALASPGRRLGASLLNALLLDVTLVIGYLVWTLVLWNQGTNPGKKLCGLQVVKADTGRPCTFGDMIVRNFVFGSLVLALIGTFTLGIGYLVDAFMVFGSRRQRLVDRMAGTLVVNVR